MGWRTYNVNTTRDGECLKAPGPHPRPKPRRGADASSDGEAPPAGQAAVAEAPASAEAGDAKRRKVEAATPVEGASPSTFQQGAALQVDIPVLMNIRQVSAGQELRYYHTPKPEKVDGKPKTKAKAPKVDLSRLLDQAAV